MNYCWLFVFLSAIVQAQTVTLSGYVREKGTQESLVGVSVGMEGTTIGTVTNAYGFYSLRLPANQVVLIRF